MYGNQHRSVSERGFKNYTGALSVWNLSLGALHWILAIENDRMTILSVQNI